MKKEIWAVIDFTNNQYSVSNLGRVKNIKTSRVLKLYKSPFNYDRCHLYHGDYPKHFSVHRLVAHAFIPNPENKPCVNHIDNNPENNNVKNLEWCTHKENIQHSVRCGRQIKKNAGSKHPRAKLTDADVSEIRRLIPLLSCKTIAKRYNVSASSISHIKNGVRWKI